MASAIAPGVILGVVFGALAVLASSGTASAAGQVGAEIHVVMQIHTKPSLANDSIYVESAQLNFMCASVTYETLQGGTTVLDGFT